jgi:hypothetical protein
MDDGGVHYPNFCMFLLLLKEKEKPKKYQKHSSQKINFVCVCFEGVGNNCNLL